MNQDWLKYLTPSNVLKWAVVVFLVCLQVIIVISIIIWLAGGFE